MYMFVFIFVMSHTWTFKVPEMVGFDRKLRSQPSSALALAAAAMTNPCCYPATARRKTRKRP